jgi:hypothetical protein
MIVGTDLLTHFRDPLFTNSRDVDVLEERLTLSLIHHRP